MWAETVFLATPLDDLLHHRLLLEVREKSLGVDSSGDGTGSGAGAGGGGRLLYWAEADVHPARVSAGFVNLKMQPAVGGGGGGDGGGGTLTLVLSLFRRN